MSSLSEQASEVAQIPKLILYGGSAFSIGQWVAENANWIAAVIGALVAVVGFILTRRDANQKKKMDKDALQAREKREREEHEARMALLRAELDKLTKPSK